MNCTQARRYPITHFLHLSGVTPDKVENEYAWYSLPNDNQTKSMFQVNREKNTWLNPSTGEKGNLVDLVVKLHQANPLGALLIIQNPTIIKK